MRIYTDSVCGTVTSVVQHADSGGLSIVLAAQGDGTFACAYCQRRPNDSVFPAYRFGIGTRNICGRA